MLNYILLALLLFSSILRPVNAASIEAIQSFDTMIKINQDASIDVIENITVYADQERIRHGIMRWLPINYMDSYGITHHTTYQLRAILVNHAKSDYHLEKSNQNLKIYVGDRHAILDPGVYTYTLQYHVNDAVNFLQDRDELYWNITGNAWDFPIYRATATVTLPENTQILQSHAYTGKMSATENNYTVAMPTPNQAIFSTTQSLAPGQGLTIAISWPKDIIQKPSTVTKLKYQIQDNKGILISLEIIVILLCYLICMWYLHGRDPRKGTIIPLFSPPPNLSPAAVRYILNMGFDMKTLTAAIVSMATQGYITIMSKKDNFTLSQVMQNTTRLTSDEKATAEKLFFDKSSIDLTANHYETLANAKSALKSALTTDFKNNLFITNSIYFTPSILLSLLALIAIISTAPDRGAALGALLWLSIWTFGCYMLFVTLVNNIRFAISLFSFSNLSKAIFTGLFALPFFAGEIIGLFVFSRVISPLTLLLSVVIVLLNILFYHLLKAPTLQGRHIMDQIEGFKLFLSTTERYRLNQLKSPELTPQLFEKYLPYAIALDVETPWGEQFNESMKLSGKDPSSYSPAWYTGTTWNNTTSSFSNFINAGLTSALNSSSSASSGGGSSGGGGGGGGGGGW